MLISTHSLAQSWELNDVSYLFPLPKISADKSLLLRPTDKGQQDILLPKNLMAKIEKLVIDYDAPKDEYAQLAVVGMRIDNCFKFLPPSTQYKEKCHPQIRLIWQPLDKEGQSEVRAFDASIHTFYDLTEIEFKNLAFDLKTLKIKTAQNGVSTAKLPLQVHPALTNPKTKSAFGSELKKIVLKYAGEKKLVRMTFMRLFTPEIWWVFGGLDKKRDGTWNPIVIPRQPQKEVRQEFFNDAFNEKIGMKGTIIPHLDPMPESINEVAKGYGIYPDTSEGKAMLKEALTTINKVDNPRLHSPATMDCVHCHITGPVEQWINKSFPKIKSDESRYVQDFVNRHNLINNTIGDHNKSLRSFGHLGKVPSINQRVINESAFVADELNKLNP